MKKQDRIYEELQQRIVTGHWGVGERISTEMELSEEFQCSRTTISKALAQLAHEGLVERRARAGTRVLRSSIDTILPTLELNACAFIYPTDGHEGIFRTTSGFQRAAGEAGARSLMLSTGPDFRKEAEILGRLAEFDIRGAVLFPVILNPDDYAYFTQMILGCHYPIVLVETSLPGLRRPAVMPDGFHAGYTMTKYLIAKGMDSIGFLSNFAWTSHARDKYLGYRQALTEAGITIDDQIVHQDQRMTPRFDDPLEEPTRIAAEYLDGNPEVRAVVCSSDYLAMGLYHAAFERGMNIPDDLAITGIDGYALRNAGDVSLTTYRIPYEKIGLRAFEVLQQLIKGSSSVLQEVLVQGELIIGQSA